MNLIFYICLLNHLLHFTALSVLHGSLSNLDRSDMPQLLNGIRYHPIQGGV